MLTIYFRAEIDPIISKKKRPRQEIQKEYNEEKAVVDSWEPSEKKTKWEKLLKKKEQKSIWTKDAEFKAPKYKLE